MANKIGWVIERYISNSLHYWNAGSGMHGRSDGFTDKHEDAVRFCREEDASIVLFRVCDGQGRVAQHSWGMEIIRCEHKNRGYCVPSHPECLDCGATHGWPT